MSQIVKLIINTCLLTAAVFPASLLAGESAERQPNIVFFFTDDQTSSTLGCITRAREISSSRRSPPDNTLA